MLCLGGAQDSPQRNKCPAQKKKKKKPGGLPRETSGRRSSEVRRLVFASQLLHYLCDPGQTQSPRWTQHHRLPCKVVVKRQGHKGNVLTGAEILTARPKGSLWCNQLRRHWTNTASSLLPIPSLTRSLAYRAPLSGKQTPVLMV